jgi:hypothetical protein
LVIDGEFRAAVLFWIERKQPAFGAKFFGQAAAKLIFLIILARRP